MSAIGFLFVFMQHNLLLLLFVFYFVSAHALHSHNHTLKNRLHINPAKLVDVLAQPPEPLAVPHSPHHGAHEHFNRAHVRRVKVDLSFARSVVRKAEAVTQLLLRRRMRNINLVPENQKRHAAQRIVTQQRV